MQKEITSWQEIKLIGITARTNNANEMVPSKAKIGATVHQFFDGTLFSKIPCRKNPGVTWCVYTDYESDFTGDYTYFIGEEVTSFESLPQGFESLTIHPQIYTKFTTEPEPDAVFAAWLEIWKMTPQDLGGRRVYSADFEVYDRRLTDPLKAMVDIYIGIQN